MADDFREGWLAAAEYLEQPYPADVFTPLSAEQKAVAVNALHALGFYASERLHAEWARHWAEGLRVNAPEQEQ